MADPLSLPEVVDTLVDMDLVDLDSDGPWPGDPEGSDVYEPDWTQIRPDDRVADATLDSVTRPSTVIDEVRKRATGGFMVPPPDVLDALAWLLRPRLGHLHSRISRLRRRRRHPQSPT